MLNWKMEIGHPKWNLKITFVDFQFLPCLNATFFIEILRDNHVGEPNLLFKRQVVFPRDTEMMRWHARDAAMLFLLLSIDSR